LAAEMEGGINGFATAFDLISVRNIARETRTISLFWE